MSPCTAGAAASATAGDQVACRLILTGHVQGVGFRPFVFRLARELDLGGTVQNQRGQVEVRVQGPAAAVERFCREVIDCAPPLSHPRLAHRSARQPGPAAPFRIVPSRSDSEAQVFVPPDYFTCADCLTELTDPTDRRYRYPFINCTQCGPRYTLILAMPYDRPATTMAGFDLCAACRAEYDDPMNRRFHAEPVACAECGPQLEFHEPGRETLRGSAAALATAVERLREGRVVAVKGIGGYHLMCNACDARAVARLRNAKPRPDKPLAVMFPQQGDDGLDAVGRHVELDPAEADLVRGPMRPIVLGRRRRDAALAPNVAPGLSEIGVFLPYSPLHHLLLADFGGPLVATSGNLSGEPVITDNHEARRRLGRMADGFLDHDRPIARPADDPVFRSVGGAPRPVRLGRGCAPLEQTLPWNLDGPVLAVGAQMKNTVALGWNDRLVVSPHIGEMDTPRGLAVFETVVDQLQTLYGVRAGAVVCDAHPGYTTARWAGRCGLPVTRVLHHHAHASALFAHRPPDGDWLVFTWDGVGYGADGTLWGGEALVGGPGHWRRAATMRPFRLPGGERSGRQPWRSAAALCWETGRPWDDGPADVAVARHAWLRQINCPVSSAVGRLFDAASALVLELHDTSFEAQGPMLLEAVCEPDGKEVRLPLHENAAGLLVTDWEPLVPVLADTSAAPGRRAADFHRSLAGALRDQAVAIRARCGVARVGLAGGVFQNRVLVERAGRLLDEAGFEIHPGGPLPVNDAAISAGQIVEYAARAAAAGDPVRSEPDGDCAP